MVAVFLSPFGGVGSQFFDSNGVILSGGKIYSYVAGTTTPQATYTSSTGTTLHSNPIILDSAGRVPGGEIWLTNGVSYKFAIYTSLGALIGTYDNIEGINIPQTAADVVLSPSGYTTATNVQTAFDNLGSTAGSSKVGFIATGNQAVSRTAQSKMRDSVSVKDFYNSGTATPWADAFEAAANSFGLNVSGQVIVPPGQYQMERTVTTPGHIHWIGDGAELYANVNNQIFFSGFPAYFTCFQGFTFFGDGQTGVRAFDLQNWRLAASIVNCYAEDVEYFAYLREGCFGSLIANCGTSRVPFPVRVGQNNAAFHILSCQFDNGATVAGTGVGTGIEIATGGIAPNIGVKITGGYIQGFDNGVIDGGVGTTLDTVYFETNVAADIFASNALLSEYRSCNHPALALSSVAYKLRNCETVTVYNPVVPSGGRSAVFDVDSSNANCITYLPPNSVSYNFPTGDMTYLGRIQAEQKGTATPNVIGSSTAGTATYTTRSLSWRKTAYGAHVEISVAWTGHTGTGALVVEGIPNDMQPSGAAPLRFGQVVASGFAIAAGQIYAFFNGTGSQLSFGYVNTAGVIALIAIPPSGTLNIVLDYDR